MTPRTIEELKAQVDLHHPSASSIEFVVDEAWTVDDEQQLSYTSLVSLAECVRELHWERDLHSLEGRGGLNTISRSVGGQFKRSILVRKPVTVSYFISDIDETSYSFTAEMTQAGVVCATVRVELVFIIEGEPGRTQTPNDVRRLLASCPQASSSRIEK